MGPGFEWMLLRNCAASAGIRLLSEPLTAALARLPELCRARPQREQNRPGHACEVVGELLASMCGGALSTPFHQLYQHQVTSAAALRASLGERIQLGLRFLKTQYLVPSEDGRTVRLSRILLRDATLRSVYIGCLLTSYVAMERTVLAFIRAQDFEK
mmetsp:Transcript_60452/g.180036  ORF Transcript_60452/g.180036 Transcript_60452/m.180036 type:complete len:157 (-) Transcript_60452:42-512(-)